MGKFDNVFGQTQATQTTQTGGKFSNVFSLPVSAPTSVSSAQPTEQPQSFLDKLKGIGGAIVGGIKSVVEHPITAVGGVEKGAMDFTFNVLKGVTGLVGADKAKQYIQDNQDAITQIFNSNLQGKDQQTAATIGHFVGEQIPYVLGAEAVGIAGKAVALAQVGKAGALSVKAVSNIGKITNWASETAGFMGVHQLVYTPEEGSRADAAKSDLLVLGALGGIGLAGSILKDIKIKSDIRKFLTDIPNKPLSEIETGTKQLLNEIKTATGKEPQALAGETLKQYPINLKEIPPNMTMGEVAKAAEKRGFPQYGKIEWKPSQAEQATQVKKVLTAGNVQQVPKQTFGGKISGMWQRVVKDIPQAEQDVMSYRGITLKGAAQRAEQIANEDPAKAYRIAMNLEKSPADTTNSMVNRVLAEKARQEGNIELQAELIKNRTLSQIRRGQEIVSEREIQGGLAKDNASFNMKQVIDERTRLLEKKTGISVKQSVAKETQSFKSKIKMPTKGDFQDFIAAITC